ncbi:MAG: DUF1294 domain-containing protein [Oscillospiraceae bacterium]|nr:DUF1294 domain-containing protein [Oscillospiraceae bacterium]MDD4368717.1 DUF1294 domain-containing protein [Oscillospiraceae bacterium]
MLSDSGKVNLRQLLSQLTAAGHRFNGPVKLLWLYLLVINLLTFILFGVDKYKAVHGLWRIREAVLLGFSLAGGSVGGLLGMWVFQHKTRVPQFCLGLPLLALVQLVLLYLGLR